MKRKCIGLFSGLMCGLAVLAVSGCGAGEDGSDASLQEPVAAESTKTDELTTSEEETTAAPDKKEESAASGVSETEEFDDTQVYDAVLQRFYELISEGGNDECDFGEGERGVWELAVGMETDDVLEQTGYAVQDISGDGIPELLIGYIAGEEDMIRGNCIYAVYTCQDYTPYLVLEGWYRNAYYYLGEGRFFNTGSESAFCSIFGTYQMTADGTDLNCEDFWYTGMKENDSSEMEFYHNTSGDTESADSEKLEISDDEFWQIEETLKKQAISLELTPFSSFAAAQGNAGTTQEALVHAEWAEEIQPEWSGYETFTADEGEYAAGVVFTSEKTVRDFKLTALTMREVDDQGNITFDASTIYTLDVLTPDHPLIVQMSLPETIPMYGISYRVNEDDETVRCFTVQISGKDGSLLLEETDW
ncbi:MAG: hypothetical protein SO101_09195 [Lachnospiraceae bacterium]|nr:hypothetical protein [Lachnospiraceae bacterium]